MTLMLATCAMAAAVAAGSSGLTPTAVPQPAAAVRRSSCCIADPDMCRRAPLRETSRTKEHVLTVIRAARPVVARCATPGGAGRQLVRVEWSIEEGGATADVRVRAPHQGTAVGACVAGVVAGLDFGPGRPIRQVAFPFPIE